MSTQTIKITGMTCGHCEGRVMTELKKISGVSEVVASAAAAHAVITADHEIAQSEISAAVLASGYKLT